MKKALTAKRNYEAVLDKKLSASSRQLGCKVDDPILVRNNDRDTVFIVVNIHYKDSNNQWIKSTVWLKPKAILPVVRQIDKLNAFERVNVVGKIARMKDKAIQELSNFLNAEHQVNTLNRVAKLATIYNLFRDHDIMKSKNITDIIALSREYAA